MTMHCSPFFLFDRWPREEEEEDDDDDDERKEKRKGRGTTDFSHSRTLTTKAKTWLYHTPSSEPRIFIAAGLGRA